jgi:hypothetical protein
MSPAWLEVESTFAGICGLEASFGGLREGCQLPIALTQIPQERSLAHAARISDDWQQSVTQDRCGARVEKEATAWQVV